MMNTKINFKEGDVFGEYSFFTGKPRETSALSVGYTKLFTFNKHDFLRVLSEDSDDYVNKSIK
jgi:CRP-like cAMP-binding protein